PTIVALRQHCENIRRAELERLDHKLAGLAQPDEARARVDEITRLIVEKLLLAPTEQLKAVGDAETIGAYSEALTRLFRLADEGEDAQAAKAGGSDLETAEGTGEGRVTPFTRPKTRPR